MRRLLLKVSVGIAVLINFSCQKRFIHKEEIEVPSKEPIVRVAILWDVETVFVRAESTISLLNKAREEKRKAPPNTSLMLISQNDSILVFNLASKQRMLSFPQEMILKSKDGVKIGRAPNTLYTYYSPIAIKIGVTHRFYISRPLTVISEVALEQYLVGVVSCELGIAKEQELEALKAQAVAARSYALSLVGKRANFDLYGSGQYDQEYRGREREYPLARKAVYDTYGEVLVYQNKVILAQYHACCGGKTNNGRFPYLKAIIDAPRYSLRHLPFCYQAPYFNWKVKINYQKFLDTLLHLSGIRFKQYFNPELKIDKKTGRVAFIRFFLDKEYKVSGDVLRKALGLRSTFFSIKKTGDSLEISGKGWGHGIGLCQYGALGMARAGYSYKKILSHYYSKIKLTKIY
jgi:stage II sporulation protein D